LPALFVQRMGRAMNISIGGPSITAVVTVTLTVGATNYLDIGNITVSPSASLALGTTNLPRTIVVTGGVLNSVKTSATGATGAELVMNSVTLSSSAIAGWQSGRFTVGTYAVVMLSAPTLTLTAVTCSASVFNITGGSQWASTDVAFGVLSGASLSFA